MSSELIFGNILLYGSIIIIILMLLKKLYNYIKAVIKGYKKTIGKVIKSIDANSEEYINQEKEKLSKNNPRLFYIMDTLMNTYSDELQECKSSEHDFFSLVEYKVENKKYIIRCKIGSNLKEPKGKKYIIRYNPKNPNEAYIVNEKWGIVYFFLVILGSFGYMIIYNIK